MVNNIGKRLLDGFFPHHCMLCGLRSHRDVPLCLECEHEMPANHTSCARCAIPLPPLNGLVAARICGSCLSSPPSFDRVIAPWLYEEYFAYLIHRWKYQREQHLTPLLASLWRQHAQFHSPIDVLVPVPLHWRRHWRRGFNQSELLCRQLQAGCPELQSCTMDHRLIRRQRATAAQSGMNAKQRARNLKGAFTVHKPCDNLRIAVVDDVLTTGATAAAMADALKAAGARHVEVWCLARTPAPGL
jgi:ComF family protein